MQQLEVPEGLGICDSHLLSWSILVLISSTGWHLQAAGCGDDGCGVEYTFGEGAARELVVVFIGLRSTSPLDFSRMVSSIRGTTGSAPNETNFTLG